MTTLKALHTASAAVGALFLSTAVVAATVPTPTDTLRAKVTGTIIAPSEQGNCFANLTKPVYLGTGVAPVCDDVKITFKCDGDDKDSAYHKFDIAQKSEITGQVMTVKLVVDPDATGGANSPCFASSVESTILKK